MSTDTIVELLELRLLTALEQETPRTCKRQSCARVFDYTIWDFRFFSSGHGCLVDVAIYLAETGPGGGLASFVLRGTRSCNAKWAKASLWFNTEANMGSYCKPNLSAT